MRALIVMLDNFIGVSRLPGALLRSGFHVAAICSPSTFLAHTRYLEQRYPWPILRHRSHILKALAAAMSHFLPDIVIPADQRSVGLLQDIATGALTHRCITKPIIDLLRASLGSSEGYAERYLKGPTCAAAEALGAPVPRSTAAPTAEHALAFAAEVGYPVVLKCDLGAAGDGVRICADKTALHRHHAELSAGPPRRSLFRRLGRAIRGGFLSECHLGSENAVRAVRYIPGTVAMRAVVAWQGEVIAGISTLREIVHPVPLGPSTLVRFIEHQDMEDTARLLVRRWGCSGFLSFDFIVCSEDDRAYLLECNPRPVPISHLGALAGSDLCASLASAMSGRSLPPSRPPAYERVVLFPQEWRRDPTSHWLTDAYHDVPWDDPDLLRALCALR